MAVDNELENLRRRAYGPQADIHLDANALERLRQLESERSPVPPVELDELAAAPEESVAPDHAEGVDEPPAAEIVTLSAPRRWWLWISGLRRSTVLIALGVVIVGVVIAVVLTVAQRVQTDPLQVGASQVARLSIDSGYLIPTVFGGSEDGTSQNAHAYQQFHGMRELVWKVDPGAGLPKTYCLSIYPQADVTDATSNSFSGQVFQGCAAGKFPAMAQFEMGTGGLPKELHSAFSTKTALQFVYDEAHHEVVVFASK
jgi:hypothetical protein